MAGGIGVGLGERLAGAPDVAAALGMELVAVEPVPPQAAARRAIPTVPRARRTNVDMAVLLSGVG
jgi:hypothetical protein